MVRQQDGKAARPGVQDRMIRRGRFPERKPVRDQRLYLHLPAADQPEKLFHVAVLRPTHVRKRIVLALLLVARVVAARPVRARHEQLDFLPVHVVPREAHVHGTHDNQATAVPADLQGLLTWRRGLRGGRDDHAVRATPVRERSHHVGERRASHHAVRRAQATGHLYALGFEVDRNDHASLQPRQLCDQLPYQPQANDGDGLPEPDAADANGIERDASERGEAGVLKRHRVRHFRGEVATREDRFPVAGAFAAVRYALADLEIRYGGMLVYNDARARIP